MSFLDKVPDNIDLLEKENTALGWKKREFYGHECDCEYCDRQEEDRDEAELDKLDKTIEGNDTMIKRLQTYQQLWAKNGVTSAASSDDKEALHEQER